MLDQSIQSTHTRKRWWVSILAVAVMMMMLFPSVGDAHQEAVVSSLHCKGKIEFYHGGGYLYINQSVINDNADCTKQVLSISVVDRYTYQWVTVYKTYSSSTGATMVDNRGIDCGNGGFKGSHPPPDYSTTAHDWDYHTGCHA